MGGIDGEKEKQGLPDAERSRKTAAYSGLAVFPEQSYRLNKVKPNMKAMKGIKKFCEDNGLAYEIIEKEWLSHAVEEK